MLTFRQFLAGDKALVEGFMGFSVGGSDTASDLSYTVELALKKARTKIKKQTGDMAPEVGILAELTDVAIKELRIGLKDEGNAYNTHGTLNVAMVMDEGLKEFRKFAPFIAFAKEVADKLDSEVARRNESDEYGDAMKRFAKKLRVWAK